jgi:hypothetical protein
MMNGIDSVLIGKKKIKKAEKDGNVKNSLMLAEGQKLGWKMQIYLNQMEIIKSNREAQALTEWKHSENSNPLVVKILDAKSGQMLKYSTEDELKQVLRYAMLLVGLRANNMPTDEEKFVLINFIQTNFQNVTIPEIKLAFDFAVAGKLKVDAKCYENFSCEYFGRIIASYIEFSRQETIVYSNKFEEAKPTPKPSFDVLKIEAIENANFFAEAIANDTNFKMLIGGLDNLYDIAKEVGIMNLSNQEKNEIWQKCKQDLAKSKSEAYKKFVNNLAIFGVRLDNDGKITQI